MKKLSAKRVSTILCLAVILAVIVGIFGATNTFATTDNGFYIVSTSPEDGAKNTTKDNMCVKVYFSTEVGSAESAKANENNKVSIVDENGTKFPVRIVYSENDPTYCLMLVDTTKLKKSSQYPAQDTNFTLTISKNFVDNNGNKLGDDDLRVVNYKTMNTSRSTAIYFVMMIAMFVCMFVFSLKQNKSQTQKDQAEAGYVEAFNPYKEAKRTGKSLAEVMAIHEKELQKQEAKIQKKMAKEGALTEGDPKRDGNAYVVKKRHTVAEGGSSYKSGRKAIAEAKAAKKAEEKAARKANNYGKPKKSPKGKY